MLQTILMPVTGYGKSALADLVSTKDRRICVGLVPITSESLKCPSRSGVAESNYEALRISLIQMSQFCILTVLLVGSIIVLNASVVKMPPHVVVVLWWGWWEVELNTVTLGSTLLVQCQREGASRPRYCAALLCSPPTDTFH